MFEAQNVGKFSILFHSQNFVQSLRYSFVAVSTEPVMKLFSNTKGQILPVANLHCFQRPVVTTSTGL